MCDSCEFTKRDLQEQINHLHGTKSNDPKPEDTITLTGKVVKVESNWIWLDVGNGQLVYVERKS